MLSNSFQYLVKYDYDTEYSCEESGCNEEGICRCSSIMSARVTEVNIPKLTDHIYCEFVDTKTKQGKRDNRLNQLFYGGEEVDKYCIDRILTYYKIWNSNVWDVNVRGGYYGDEINDVKLSPIIFESIAESCKKLFSLENISDKIKLVLSLEYGYILDDMKDSNFEIIEINRDDIDFTKLNQKHISNVKNENLDHYKSKMYDLARGIVRMSGDKFTIVDGFHRILAFDKDKVIPNSKFKVFSII